MTNDKTLIGAFIWPPFRLLRCTIAAPDMRPAGLVLFMIIAPVASTLLDVFRLPKVDPRSSSGRSEFGLAL